MEHNDDKSIEPINTFFCSFGVQYENQFVVLNDNKHVIGVDAGDGKNVIIKNLENGKSNKFTWSDSSNNLITTLVYYEKTGFLYTGYSHGHLCKYKIDIKNKIFQRVKDYGDLGIKSIFSSHRFMDFVFFGGSESRIRVLDLSTGELLTGSL